MFLQHAHAKMVLVFAVAIAVTTPLFSQAPQKSGYLKIESDSAGIEIYLDHKLMGYTPLSIIALAPGEYLISAYHPKRFVWGNMDWQDRIKIAPDDTSIVTPEFQTALNIRTQPFDAAVFINNEFQGNTPLLLAIPPSNGNTLVLRKDGYRDFFVDLNEVKSASLNIKLIDDSESNGFKITNETYRKKLKQHYRKIAYSLWGLSILSGLSTIYLKDQADEKYRRYLSAGSLADMNTYYRDSKRFDQYSYGSFGVLQGCFLLSFYFLMKSLN